MEKIKSFLPDLFTALNTDDSIAVLVFLGVSFLLGLLFGAWSRSGKISRLKKELAQKETDLSTLRTQYDLLVEQFEKKEQDLKDSEVRFNQVTDEVNKFANERMHFQTELRSAREQLAILQQENLDYAAQLENPPIDSNPIISTTDENNNVSNNVNDDRLSLIEEKLERLVLENANLKEEISNIERVALTAGAGAVVVGAGVGMNGGGSTSTSGAIVTDTETGKSILDLSETTVIDAPPTYENEVLEEDYSEMSPQERASRSKSKIGMLIGKKIPTASLSEKDDLKKLEGIGPFIEMKLNDIGIFTYEQVSMFDDEVIDLITDAIQFFPGRIQKDDWMGQAASLMG